MYFGGGAQHCHEVAVPAHLDSQHAKAGVGDVKRHALDEPGERLALLVS